MAALSTGVGSSRFVVAGCAGGVVNVRAPHLISLPVNVLVQTVCVGPVTDPSRNPVPYEDEPVQVAAVEPARLQLRCAVLLNFCQLLQRTSKNTHTYS